MARLFVTASSQSANRGSNLGVAAAPMTMALWYRPTTNNYAGSLFALGDATVANYFVISVTAGTAAYAGIASNSPSASATVGSFSAILVAGTWIHLAVVFTSSTSRAFYINGVSDGTDTTSVVPVTPAISTIGGIGGSSITSWANGDIAECAAWAAALTADELAGLAAGAAPTKIRPASLRFYAPLDGVASPELDWMSASKLTLAGAPAASDHPRIFRPKIVLPADFAIPAAPGGLLPRMAMMGAG